MWALMVKNIYFTTTTVQIDFISIILMYNKITSYKMDYEMLLVSSPGPDPINTNDISI